ncbi:DEAD/DEAH box helicase [Candidatus Nomurabacteria bacterium]|nr:DEAD/DEAH box helicase [Candidatus Nomurabacteria bacterium]
MTLSRGIDYHDKKKYMIKTRSFARPASSGVRAPSRFAGPAKSSSRPFTTGKPVRSFGTSKPAFGARKSFGGGGFKKNSFSRNSRPAKRGRFGGERIDYSRFIQKAVKVEEKPYIAKHTFADFPFNEQLHKNITRKGYTNPRPIQDQSIPSVIEGKDVFGLANTGTGKTAAFLLPLIDKVMKDKTQKVLVLAPTRELAMQIEEELRSLAFGSGLYGVCVVGGMPIMKQINEITRGVSFVIGTPGRVMDLIKRKVLDLAPYKYVVLDEADRMLDMGFRDDMVSIISKTSPDKQTLFFSATLSPEIKKLTADFLKNPVFISVVSGETAKNIDQDVVKFKTKESKIELLHEVLKSEGTDKILIFREMKHAVDDLSKELGKIGFKVGTIHGDKRSRDRIRTLDLFKTDKINILIATDVAARGLDIPDVTHVINYDVPQTYDTYVHRIGRTGRAGKKGTALTFVPAH